ncbi:hypothetical protein SAY86_029563 [Trapa natans]|uniref:Uncharacterized protein n=1 Tax=Trapa natans TaxID=22666 RepID=A0AAN7RC14_TRANT|nr:hypothetical protein SAY86_029563 [Trapa natans]
MVSFQTCSFSHCKTFFPRLVEDLCENFSVFVQDHDNTAAGNDTEFLNVDDDELNEDNGHLSDVEDSQTLDNSGWSSRTRSVAKYLQTLFDRGAVQGKPSLAMDSLLTGKTRKKHQGCSLNHCCLVSFPMAMTGGACRLTTWAVQKVLIM